MKNLRHLAAEFRRPASIMEATPKLYGSLKNCHSRVSAFRFGVFAAGILGVPWAATASRELWEPSALMTESTNTAGGALVPDEFQDEIIVAREKYGVIRKYARVCPMASETLRVPRRTAGLTAYPVGEGVTATETTSAFNGFGFVAKKWITLLRASSELSEDAISAFGDYILGEFAYSFAVAEDNAGFAGDGTSTYAGITGLKNALLGGCVSTSAGTTWASITAAEVSAWLALSLDYEGAKDPAIYCSKAFFHAVLERLAIASGTASGLQIVNGLPQYFFNGYPVRFTKSTPTATAVNTISAYFGDLSLAVALGDRRQVTVSSTLEGSVGGQSTWERDELSMKATERIDIVCFEPGTATVAGPVAALSTHS